MTERRIEVWQWLGAIMALLVMPVEGASAEAAMRVQFREPSWRAYEVEQLAASKAKAAGVSEWIKAWPVGAPQHPVLFGNRVVVQLQPGVGLGRVLDSASGRLRFKRVVAGSLYVLQAPSAPVAIEEAERLAQLAEVVACQPVRRRQVGKLGLYAAKPDDPYFKYQWYNEHRGEDGHSLGVDLNVRAAWPYARGEGITIGIADDGVDVAHPELALRSLNALNYNFETFETNGMPTSIYANHGTAVAGLAVAEGYDGQGMIGVAFGAQLASWIIFTAGDYIVDDEALSDMFQYAGEEVQVQNHSWGNASEMLLEPTLLEQAAISNAVHQSRGGKGVVMVRAAGNRREDWSNANDDGYAASPWAIAVAAVRTDGRAASYSNPGACILVAAPSGDREEEFPMIFTTDRVGELGYNQATFTNDFANYAFDDVGFSGTSAASPQVAGVAALVLSANPSLTYRDVQQILLLAARHFDPQDPDLVTNGAGLVVSHNDGYGVPDAGQAVELALSWSNRPAAITLTHTNNESRNIPEDGLRLHISGPGLPESLRQIRCLPSQGPHADVPTAEVPLVDVGMATNAITEDLRGKAAVILRGTNLFSEKIRFAADSGAEFAVVSNNRAGDQLVRMAGTDFTPIPAVFISENDGAALRAHLPRVARIRLDSATYAFPVTDSVACEQVGVRISFDHPRRGDLRVTLTSPSGVCSVLQHLNSDEVNAPLDWTYYSTHHFFESSQGIWTVAISDEEQNHAGTVGSVRLLIHGVPLLDTDQDGLDDHWELEQLQTLAYGPKDDPDQDGYSNLRESLAHSHPLREDRPLVPSLSVWNPNLIRLSWPSTLARDYEVWTATDASAPWTLLTRLPGLFPETIWFAPHTNGAQQFYQVRSAP
jgi:subtilisin-like proprotein convertase family protein/subtilisin family serine protease